MGFGWEGRKVRLVPLEHERHFENCYRWINDPEISEHLLVNGPISRLAEQDWFEKAARSDGTQIHFAIETLDGEHVGNSGIHRIDHHHGTCRTGSLIGRKDLWGQGLGTDAARVRSRYIFDILNMRMTLSSVLEDNPGSLRMQEKAGYEVYGRIPKRLWKHGRYRDEILTILTRERWEQVRDA